MIGKKLKEAANSARLRAGQMWRERKERSEAKKATAAMNSEHGHGRFFLLHVPAMATICAAVVEWYWAILFCIEATGSIDWNYQTASGSAVAAASVWNFTFDTHWPIFLGLVCATIPIVMLSMVWLPVQFAMRGSGMWRRGTVIAVGVLANLLVIVSGTVVMNGNRQEQVRAGMVVEEQAQANRGAIEAQIAAVNDDLARLTDRRINNEYAATAANVGAVAYRAQYMSAEALARSPEARRDIIVRALGAAERADALRAERAGLFQQMAQAPTAAAVAANVADPVGAELNAFAQAVEVWRPPFVAVICCLIGIFGAWWVLALMQGLNPRDVMRSGWADEAHRIEDKTDEPSIVPQPMRPAREVVTDAETGEELIKITPKPHWRKTKGKKQTVEFQPEIPPDETGVEHDGGGRVGSVAAVEADEVDDHPRQDHERDNGERPANDGLSEDAFEPPPAPEEANQGNDGDSEARHVSDQNDSPSEALSEPELTEAERAEFAMLAATSDGEAESDEPTANDQASAHLEIEGRDEQANASDANADDVVVDEVSQTDLPAEREPETDERRLIAANVAAE